MRLLWELGPVLANSDQASHECTCAAYVLARGRQFMIGANDASWHAVQELAYRYFQSRDGLTVCKLCKLPMATNFARAAKSNA